MKVYIVKAFDAEPYNRVSWVDSVFSSLESAQAYINEYKDKNGRSTVIESGNGRKYILSDYITTRDVKGPINALYLSGNMSAYDT